MQVQAHSRTRRKSGRVTGNNPYGRTGKPRCLNCRRWRQKVSFLFPLILKSQCDYKETHLPCTVCERRGLECGEKLLISKSKFNNINSGGSMLMQSSLFTNDNIDYMALGEEHLQSFGLYLQQQNGVIITSGRNQDYVRVMGISNIVYPFPEEFPWSSECSQCALIALESSRRSLGKWNGITNHYVQQARKSLVKAIDGSNVIETLIASYALLLYTCFSEDVPFRTTAIYYNGISAACAALSTQPLPIQSKYLASASKLWIISLHLLEISYWGAVRRSLRDRSQQYGLKDDIYAVIQYGYGLTCLERLEGWKPFRSEICATEPLRTNLMFCLDYYLASKSRALPGKDAKDRSCSLMNDILQQIVARIPRRILVHRLLYEARNILPPQEIPVSNFAALKPSISVNDICDALLFGIAKLIQQLIECEYQNKAILEALPSAKFLCSLCALSIGQTGSRDLLLTYGLFLAGLIIRERINPERIGTGLTSADFKVNRWIRKQLKEEREYRRHIFVEQGDHSDSVYDSLCNMLDLVDSRMDSNMDIFSLESGGISMSRCHQMMGSLSCFPC